MQKYVFIVLLFIKTIKSELHFSDEDIRTNMINQKKEKRKDAIVNSQKKRIE